MNRLPVIILMLVFFGSCQKQQNERLASQIPRVPNEFSKDFLLQQQIILEANEQEYRFQAVLQNQGNLLTLIGLTPFGTRAFILKLAGEEFEFTSYLTEQELPFSPTLILRDIKKTLLPWISRTPLEEGRHQKRIGDEIVIEQWRAGRIFERRFSQPSSNLLEDIVITYEDGYVFDEAPGKIIFKNNRARYRLTLTTLSYQIL